MTSLVAQVNVYRLKNAYALYEVTSDGVDTVGVWGSNPHAPTIRINNLRGKRLLRAAFCVVVRAITLRQNASSTSLGSNMSRLVVHDCGGRHV
ncbi:MAG: hypothetical protein LC776_14065 [Acidobacteria bacterium]|nr:hypothetical protein [Acidobacteriota bacterium]